MAPVIAEKLIRHELGSLRAYGCPQITQKTQKKGTAGLSVVADQVL